MTKRWYGLSEDILDELLLMGRASFSVRVGDHIEHIVLEVTNDDSIDIVYEGRE